MSFTLLAIPPTEESCCQALRLEEGRLSILCDGRQHKTLGTISHCVQQFYGMDPFGCLSKTVVLEVEHGHMWGSLDKEPVDKERTQRINDSFLDVQFLFMLED